MATETGAAVPAGSSQFAGGCLSRETREGSPGFLLSAVVWHFATDFATDWKHSFDACLKKKKNAVVGWDEKTGIYLAYIQIHSDN